jgi:hypothetical protein
MSLYKDYPLQTLDSIRLVMLHSATMDTVVELDMATAVLSAKSKYITLSYTWSDPIDGRYSPFPRYETLGYNKCSGKRLQIHQILFDALWQLREKQEFTPLWIDAIHIDQVNNKERNSQLSLMPSIYGVHCTSATFRSIPRNLRLSSGTADMIPGATKLPKQYCLTLPSIPETIPKALGQAKGRGLSCSYQRQTTTSFPSFGPGYPTKPSSKGHKSPF